MTPKIGMRVRTIAAVPGIWNPTVRTNCRWGAVGVIDDVLEGEDRIVVDVRHTRTANFASASLVTARYDLRELKILDGGRIMDFDGPCESCFGTGKDGHFRCPKCGSHRFSSAAMPFSSEPIDLQDESTYYWERLSPCGFRWSQEDDLEYWVKNESPCDSCHGSGKNVLGPCPDGDCP